MIHLIPGDPVRAALGPTAPPELVEATREALGLERPAVVQYLHYLRDLFTGDLGTSMISGCRSPTSSRPAAARHARARAASRSSSPWSSRCRSGVAMAVRDASRAAAPAELGFTSTSVVLGGDPRLPPRRRPGLRVRRRSSAGCPSPGARARTRTSCRWWRSPSGRRPCWPASCAWRCSPSSRRTTSAPRAPSGCRARRIYFGHALPNALTATLTLARPAARRRWSSARCSSRTSSPGPAWAARSSQSIIDKDYPWCRRIVLVYGIGVLLVNSSSTSSSPCSTRARTIREELSRWRDGAGPRPPHAGRGRARLVAAGAVLLTGARWRPIIWGDAGRRRSTRRRSRRARRRALGRHRWPRAGHLLRVLVATRLSVVLALAATAIGVGVGRDARRGPMLSARPGGRHRGAA